VKKRKEEIEKSGHQTGGGKVSVFRVQVSGIPGAESS
jgi:hypothetical protein